MEKNYGLQPPIPFGFKSLAGFIVIFIIWQGGALLGLNLTNALIPATRSGLPSLITLYLSFFFLILGVYIVIRYFFKIRFRAFLFEGKRPDYRTFAKYFSLYVMALILYILVDIAVHPQAFTLHFNPLPWLGVLLVTAPLILIQSAAEEILFRGYMYRMFRSLRGGVFWSIFLTSLTFALIHGLNPEMLNYGIFGPLYYLQGAFFLGIVAYYTNGLAAPIGIHFATNIFNTSIWGYGSSALDNMGLQSIVYRHTLDMRFAFFGIFAIVISYSAFQFFKQKRNRL
ncbi:CPBP family intramembrane metalloprotease [Paenibacillus chitinolyticus]|uniref:CPBP family intramembrane glutamic endopeptidase n=1 Tax=Paenibacillus chitinolyticus TaxID=79263 RepID=UPI002DBB6698|nr:CPBP family intramembrane glutamic endopeptidase [Paenibacillus chitinolyticus]MEC0245391.1 CPBP family intramembrane metalloprotease [Paenibacillus chitinolyticus]